MKVLKHDLPSQRHYKNLSTNCFLFELVSPKKEKMNLLIFWFLAWILLR